MKNYTFNKKGDILSTPKHELPLGNPDDFEVEGWGDEDKGAK